jgi:phospholipid/cholesterol/gamma-HCH transport system substrate-binding protein
LETRAHHVVIGAFALAVLVLGMLFALWIGKSTLDRQWHDYVIVFNESVTGLTVGGSVQYNGIQVGEVRRLSLDPQNPSRVMARVRLDATVPVKTDTRAKLTFTGLTGVALIQLSGGSLDAPLLTTSGDDPTVIVADPSALQKLLLSSEDIATTASEVLLRVNRLLDEDNVARVSQTLENLDTISTAAAAGQDDIRTVLSEAASASRRLAELLVGAESVMRRLDDGLTRADHSLSREMPKLLARLDESLGSLQRLSENAEGMLAENREAVADFGQQGLSQVGPSLVELRGLIADLRRISARIEASPPDFVLGRQALPEYTPK